MIGLIIIKQGKSFVTKYVMGLDCKGQHKESPAMKYLVLEKIGRGAEGIKT